MALTKVSNSMLVQPVNHNILINPSFTVKQRGSSVTLAHSDYTLDRWTVAGKSSIGGNGPVTVTQDVNIPYVRMKVSNQGTPTAHSFAIQKIETVNLFGAFGKEMTLSFGYSSSTSTLPVVSIGQYNASGAVTWLATDAVVTPYGSNKFKYTFTLPNLSPTDTPDLNDAGLQVRITADEGNIAPSEWSLWETKLEVGSVVTPFIARSHGEELALCQRYYQPFGSGVTAGNSVGGSGYNSRVGLSSSRLPVTMRVQPSLTIVEDAYLAAWCGPGGQVIPASDAGIIAKTDMNLGQVITDVSSVTRASIAVPSATQNTLVAGGIYGSTKNFLALDAEL